MTNDISEGMPHTVTELICVKCLHRSIHVFPSHIKTKDLECSCGETGYLIRTGEEIFDE